MEKALEHGGGGGDGLGAVGACHVLALARRAKTECKRLWLIPATMLVKPYRSLGKTGSGYARGRRMGTSPRERKREMRKIQQTTVTRLTNYRCTIDMNLAVRLYFRY